MSAVTADGSEAQEVISLPPSVNGQNDPFSSSSTTPNRQAHLHRYSSRFDLDHSPFGTINSPSQVKRVLEAHLVDTEQRLQDTKTLGESLLAQQSKLQDKLREVEQQQDEIEITPELKQQLQAIGQEHDDVSREIARSLLAPKSRAVSGEEQQQDIEPPAYTSQASGSPTKISAPNRRQRNQPTSRTADVQFAADISVSLLAQVRALQAAVAERDEVIRTANSDRLRLDSDLQGLSQRIRTHDENEQRYKDENWNLETRNHELLSAAKEASDKEKRVNASLAIVMAERTRLLNEVEEIKQARDKLSEEHSSARKAHETELHSLKKDVDAADLERTSLQGRVDELTSQNQELARAVAGKYRNVTPNQPMNAQEDQDGEVNELGTPEHSPPPSPTKATPRHGGLESETLRSSLHHAHRQIQNLKSNIHREKTEKIELKRMLQDARDELEQSRSGLSNGSKKQKLKGDAFKRAARPEMLGNNRRTRTDVEVDEDDWEDTIGVPSGAQKLGSRAVNSTNATDMSDAYATAHETENDFETADERHTTESEAFETGAESLAGDSSDDLTETEDNVPRTERTSVVGTARSSLAGRAAGNRSSYYSTASTSAGEEDEALHTPMQAQPHRFRMKNGRSSYHRQSQFLTEGTPDSAKASSTQASPATVTDGRSPPGIEQSLFTELGGMDDTNSDTYGTPARSSVISPDTPGSTYTPSKPTLAQAAPISEKKTAMVDCGVMTEEWQPEPVSIHTDLKQPTTSSFSGLLAAHSVEPSTAPRPPSPSDFPLPPSVPSTPARRNDSGTQYTPQRSLQGSPLRNTAFITPPKTTWDEAHEAESPHRDQSIHSSHISKPSFAYSQMLSQETLPVSPVLPVVKPPTLAFSTIISQNLRPITPEKKAEPIMASNASIVEGTQNKGEQSTVTGSAAGAASGGFLAGAAAVFGLKSKDKYATTTTENNSIKPIALSAAEDNDRVLRGQSLDTAANTTLPKRSEQSESTSVPYLSSDQGAQTTLTAEQIEQALRPKTIVPPATASVSASVQLAKPSRSPPPLVTLQEIESPYAAQPPVPALSPNRPSSSSSAHRTPSFTSQSYPPLPSDYKTTIARANSMATSQPSNKKEPVQANTIIMGPPLMPASAMRRPRTPGEPTRPSTRDAAPSRASQSSRLNRGLGSQLSHRSSVSSFASELDERFNIRTDGHPLSGQYQGPVTDPRMIQAITQTMIGEYLWKYTRRAGGREMSTTRHRRYFWVHPYNKTLHWSVNDPQSAGSKEAKSKGVVIESVRVVTDDNPMPPGLHRKSLEITTPGRKIKLTASTGQRHETWFNALSYLLLRGDPADAARAYTTGDNEVTREDIEEFNGNGYEAHLARSTRRLSMSSYNSRTTSNTAYRSSRQALPSNVVATGSVSRQPELTPSAAIPSDPLPSPVEEGRSSRGDQLAEGDRDRTIRAKSVSRISRMFGSVTGRQSQTSMRQSNTVQNQGHKRQESGSSIYDASVVSDSRKDSAEDMRQEMLQEEEDGLGPRGLENVRACCDGKHDVSSLSHGGHHHDHRASTLQSMSDRINRSMSRRK